MDIIITQAPPVKKFRHRISNSCKDTQLVSGRAMISTQVVCLEATF